MKIAGFEKRIISYLIDFVIPLLLAVYLSFRILEKNSAPWLEYVLLIEVLAASIYTFINTIFMALTHGLTLGTLIVKTKITPLNSKNMHIRRILIRNVGMAVLPMVFVNIFFMLTVHTERSIFDRLSDSIVVNRF